MSKRSVASGTVSFGLVSIPVKFYLTAQAKTVSFNMITPKGNRVKQKVVDSITGEDISYSSCSKGYEVSKDNFVILSKEELKALGEDDGGTIEILEFVPATSLKVVEVEKTYYLDSGKGGDRAYRLLVKALTKQEKCAVAQWTSRGRQHLVIIGVMQGALVAHQMFYADEMREFDLDCATYAPKDIEVDLACQLIDSLSTASYNPAKFTDTYRDRVNKAVAAKSAGMAIPVSAEENKPVVSDLFAALQASLKKVA